MRHSRRSFLRTTGIALGAGTLATGAAASETPTAAAERPDVTWDPAHYSNYTSWNRSASDVRWIVLHTIEGPASAGISWFKNPDSNVSSHFVVDAQGDITKMVRIEDVAYTNGNGPYNRTGINVEMAGYANETQFSEAMYDSVGQLIGYLCDTYDVPVVHPADDIAPCSAYGGQGGVIGHDQIPSQYDCSRVTGGKVDPGSTWDWEYAMATASGGADGFAVGDAVETSTTANVRAEPTIGDNVVFTNPAGERGVIKAGAESADGYTWWRVVYENGVAGWTAATTLDDAAVTFLHDQRVETTADLVIHSDPALSAPDVWTAPEGSGGYVRAGPQQADGYLWWEVAFNAGERGWCVEEYLDAAPVEGNGLTPETPDVTTFDIGQAVNPTTDLVVHDGPALDDPNVGVVAPTDTGYVKNGIVTNDGYTWWDVDWTDGPRGWSVEAYLEGGEGVDGRDPLPFDVGTDLTDPVAVTGQEIDDAIAAERPDSPLIGLGDTFVAVQEAFSVNAVYQAAHAVHESAWGTSTIAQDKRNLFGWGAEDSDPYGGAKRFDSFEDCVWYVMEQVKTQYLTPGDFRYNGPNLDGMNVYYATDDRWDVKIVRQYRTIANNI